MKNRRDFIKAGLAAGAFFSLNGFDRLLAADTPPAAPSAPPAVPRPTLAAVRDGSRADMLDRALEELGGIGAFVRKGQRVLVKPNIGWDRAPESGANTHPELVTRLITLCLGAGAASVVVFDNTCDQWQLCYANSGIEKAATEAGARVFSGRDREMYREVEIPGGVTLRKALVHELVLDSDVWFNVPVLKHHFGSGMTACLKNHMGVVWDRRFYHRNNLHQCIADFLTFKKPDLNILDAWNPMVRNGPHRGAKENHVEMRTLLASTDGVIVDAAAARLLGVAPADVQHIPIAAGMGLGSMDLENADIRRIKLGA